MNTFIVTLRETAREQHRVFEQVKKTKKTAIVINRHKGPQVAIVPLEDLEELEKIRLQKSAMALLRLGDLAQKYRTKRPATDAVKDTKTIWD